MRIVVADDEAVQRRLLARALEEWGHAPVLTSSGDAAWDLLTELAAPAFVILDWMMPGLSGPDLCRRIRASPVMSGSYVLLVTARAERGDLVTGLDAGADDFLTKPVDWQQLRARVGVGERIFKLQAELSARVRSLETALGRVDALEGLLPICAQCKSIRGSNGEWEPLEEIVSRFSRAQFTHGICPDCVRALA